MPEYVFLKTIRWREALSSSPSFAVTEWGAKENHIIIINANYQRQTPHTIPQAGHYYYLQTRFNKKIIENYQRIRYFLFILLKFIDFLNLRSFTLTFMPEKSDFSCSTVQVLGCHIQRFIMCHTFQWRTGLDCRQPSFYFTLRPQLCKVHRVWLGIVLLE